MTFTSGHIVMNDRRGVRGTSDCVNGVQRSFGNRSASVFFFRSRREKGESSKFSRRARGLSRGAFASGGEKRWNTELV